MPDRSWLVDENRGVGQAGGLVAADQAGGSPDRGGMVWTYLQLTGEKLLPTTSLPFAIDAGGNFFLLDRVTGRVWFMPVSKWKHENSLEAVLDALTGEAPAWVRD